MNKKFFNKNEINEINEIKEINEDEEDVITLADIKKNKKQKKELSEIAKQKRSENMKKALEAKKRKFEEKKIKEAEDVLKKTSKKQKQKEEVKEYEEDDDEKEQDIEDEEDDIIIKLEKKGKKQIQTQNCQNNSYQYDNNYRLENMINQLYSKLNDIDIVKNKVEKLYTLKKNKQVNQKSNTPIVINNIPESKKEEKPKTNTEIMKELYKQQLLSK